MNSDSKSLDVLMAQLAQGERAVFASVFDLLWGPIFRMCSSLLESEADAADAAQETMHKIFQRASDYDPARPALPWAMAIAGWECRTLVRKRMRRRETTEPIEERGSAQHETEIVQRDLVAAVVTALGELSGADRETLLATFWDEAASVSGSTLRKRRERALDRLRQAYWRLYGRD